MTGARGPNARGAMVCWAALNRYIDADGMRQGAAVAFYAAFSMAPLLVVVTGVMVWLLGNDNAQAALLEAITRLVGPRETQTLSELLVRHGSTTAQEAQAVVGSWLALGTTLIGATGVFVEMRSAVQAMLGEREGEFTWYRLLHVRLLAIGIVLGCGFLLSIAMIAQTATLLALKWLTTAWAWLSPVLIAVEMLWSWGVISLIFALMIRWLPNTRLPWRDVLIGAAQPPRCSCWAATASACMWRPPPFNLHSVRQDRSPCCWFGCTGQARYSCWALRWQSSWDGRISQWLRVQHQRGRQRFADVDPRGSQKKAR
jgi:membrane protein